MKRLISFVLVILILGCDSEDAPDCFQSTGDIVRKEVIVPDFTKILVNPNVELILKEDEETSVIIETGDNLLNEVSAHVRDEQLILSDTNECAFFREFNQTKIFVSAPNITEIRSATQFEISSDGILNYPSLVLLSEDFNETGGNTTGIFNLQVRSEQVNVVGNNIASFFIRGETNNLNVNFASGTGRFEGADLMAQNVNLFHRGTNKIIVNPRESLIGEIRSTGDVIAVHKPETVEVQQFFTGRLVFQ